MRAKEFLIERGQMPIYYFAYGMLTNPKNVPGAEYIGTAELRNHRMTFYHWADVISSPSDTVQGVLWSLPDGMLKTLDDNEGYPQLYGRKTVPVFLDGQRYEAIVYHMTPQTHEQLAQKRRPARNYLSTMGRGYIKAGLPSDQIHDAVRDSMEVVQEVAMNPAAYADSMTAAAEKGVLVGFEFEVCVPESTIKNYKPEKSAGPPKTSGLEDLIELYQSGNLTMDANEFDQTFRARQRFKYKGKKYSSVREIVDKVRDKIRKDIKKIYSSLDANTRNFIVRKWRKSQAYQKGNTEDQFMSWLSDPDNLKGEEENRIWEIFDYFSWPPNENNIVGDVLLANRRNFKEIFDFDDAALSAKYHDAAEESRNAYDEDDYNDYDYTGAARILKPAVEQTMGTKVRVFQEYHQQKKNAQDWYIEPDGSLEPQDGDGAAEVVSPPLPVTRAIADLKKFYAMARQLNLYTNSSTGLHINVSIPGKLDVMKLAMFLGDQHVLQAFNREDNEYASSVLADLQRSVQQEPGEYVSGKKSRPTQLNMKALQALAQDVTDDHTASISNNGKYISFRHVGNDYLSDPTAIINVVGRFVRAMVIAADPAAYREDYIKKLTKLVGSVQSSKTPQSSVTWITDIRKNGVPVVIVDTQDDYEAVSKNDVLYTIERSGRGFLARIEADPATPQQVAQSLGTAPRRGRKYKRFIVIPRNVETLQRFDNLDQREIRYRGWKAATSRIPLTDPRALDFVRDLAKYIKQLVQR